MKKILTAIFALILLSSCNQDPKTSKNEPVHLDTLQGTSFLGIALTIKQLDHLVFLLIECNSEMKS